MCTRLRRRNTCTKRETRRERHQDDSSSIIIIIIIISTIRLDRIHRDLSLETTSGFVWLTNERFDARAANYCRMRPTRMELDIRLDLTTVAAILKRKKKSFKTFAQQMSIMLCISELTIYQYRIIYVVTRQHSSLFTRC